MTLRLGRDGSASLPSEGRPQRHGRTQHLGATSVPGMTDDDGVVASRDEVAVLAGQVTAAKREMIRTFADLLQICAAHLRSAVPAEATSTGAAPAALTNGLLEELNGRFFDANEQVNLLLQTTVTGRHLR
jgi:hypothetical protein